MSETYSAFLCVHLQCAMCACQVCTGHLEIYEPLGGTNAQVPRSVQLTLPGEWSLAYDLLRKSVELVSLGVYKAKKQWASIC